MRTALLLILLATATAAAAPGLARGMIDVEHATTCGATRVALRVHPPLTLSPHAELAVALRPRAACHADAPGDAAATRPAAMRLSGRLSLGARTALVAAVQYDADGGLRASTRRAW